MIIITIMIIIIMITIILLISHNLIELFLKWLYISILENPFHHANTMYSGNSSKNQKYNFSIHNHWK